MVPRRGTRVCNTCGFACELVQRGQCQACVDSSRRIILNELLCYAHHHVDRSSAQALWEAVTNFYHPDEIKAAKSILWDSYSDILPDTQQHRDSLARAAHEKEAWEIIDALIKIRDSNDEEYFQFVALDFNRLLNHGPEEISVASVLQRVIDIERQHRTIQQVMEKNTESITTLFDINLQTRNCATVVGRDFPRHLRVLQAQSIYLYSVLTKTYLKTK